MAISQPLKVKLLLSVVVLLTLAFLFWVFVLDCLLCAQRPKLPWRIDGAFTERLMAGPYGELDGIDNVDGIQIYETRQIPAGDWYERVSSGDLVYETSDKQKIRSIISSLREYERADNCENRVERKSFDFIAVDNTFMRAAYFEMSIRWCEAGQYVNVHSPDSEYGPRSTNSRRLAETLRALGAYSVVGREAQ